MKINPTYRLATIGAAVWMILLGWVAFLYASGLHGPFILDDYDSLAKLGWSGGIADWESFLAFVFGGTSGPTGRPVVLLSFLLDGQSWPTQPFPFKRTNLILHLINGTLLLVISLKVQQLLGYENSSVPALLVAIFAALLWLVHPFLVSTTLYVVQRMAMLATTFSFLAIFLYLRGRQLLQEGSLRGCIWVSIGVGVCLVLGVFSKENAALIPVFLLLLEFALFKRCNRSFRHCLWLLLFGAIPTLLLLGYLFSQLTTFGWTAEVPFRDFSVYERCLTQARVLFDYLGHWFVPRAITPGVFNDGYIKSVGVFEPVSTFTSIVGHIFIIGLSWKFRKRYPLLLFAVSFFYVAHLVESTVVPLEMYFEHRNYLAMAFLALPVLRYGVDGFGSKIVTSVFAVFLALASFATWQKADIWSNYDTLVIASAEAAPRSYRAQQSASHVWLSKGDVEAALRTIDQAKTSMPDNYSLRVWSIVLGCQTKTGGAEDFEFLLARAREAKFDIRSARLHQELVDRVSGEGCPDVESRDLIELYRRISEHPDNRHVSSIRRAELEYLLGKLYLGEQEYNVAGEHFKRVLMGNYTVDAPLVIATEFAKVGELEKALYFVREALSRVRSGGVTKSNQPRSRVEGDIIEFRRMLEVELGGSHES